MYSTRSTRLTALAATLVLSACTDGLRRPDAEAPAPVVQRSRPAPPEPAPDPVPAAGSAISHPPAPAAVPTPPPAPAPAVAGRGEGALRSGIEAYENGDYPGAQQRFQAALAQGLGVPAQIQAHKYLAFISCATGQTRTCESHFRRILVLDRHFRLTAAEAGHPQWGPVFRRLKGR